MRKSVLSLCMISAAVCIASSAANATTTVTFVAPEKFTDMPFAPYEKDRVIAALKAHFEKLAAKLPEGQDFKVEVLDVDLAGERDYRASAPQDLRILRGGADWPKMELRYSVESQGKVLKSGTAHVADMNYLQSFNQYTSGEYLRYEKRMLDAWFKKTILEAKVVAKH